MSKLLTTILIVSYIGFLFGVLYRYVVSRKPGHLIISLVFLIILFIFLNLAFGFPRIIETKDAVEEVISIVLCYIFMLLGMVAQYFYIQAESGHKKIKFELLPFLMPIFASPIVFIPLLTLLENIHSTGAFSKSKLMIYLIGFQNGFFWKTIFKKQPFKGTEGSGK